MNSKNFKIPHQIGLISVTAFCGFALIAGIYLAGEKTRDGIKERQLIADEVYEIAERIRSGLINARQIETNFRLHLDAGQRDLHVE
jgi:hypothetical protein